MGSQVRIQVPEYGSHTRDLFRSRFPSADPGSRVRVQVPEYGSHTRDLFRSRFPSTGPGSRVQVQVPEYSKGLAQYQWLIRYILLLVLRFHVCNNKNSMSIFTYLWSSNFVLKPKTFLLFLVKVYQFKNCVLIPWSYLFKHQIMVSFLLVLLL